MTINFIFSLLLFFDSRQWSVAGALTWVAKNPTLLGGPHVSYSCSCSPIPHSSGNLKITKQFSAGVFPSTLYLSGINCSNFPFSVLCFLSACHMPGQCLMPGHELTGTLTHKPVIALPLTFQSEKPEIHKQVESRTLMTGGCPSSHPDAASCCLLCPATSMLHTHSPSLPTHCNTSPLMQPPDS